ncbi:transposase, partial [Acetobacter oeni]
PMSAFFMQVRTGGKAQYHPRLMLALLIFSYANGLFSSRRIERATYRDIGVRYDRIKALREKLAADIAGLMEQAERADATDNDPQALPEELARRETLKAKLDEACARLEAEAKEQAEVARPAYEQKKAAYDAKTGRRGRAPKPPDDEPPPERQVSLTDPDSRLMRRSDAHEVRQAYNAQAVVCAEGSQLIVTTGVVATSADAPSFADTVLAMEKTTGLPATVLADTGYASGKAVRRLRDRGVDPLVAIGRPCARRPYDFRPPPGEKEPRRITKPWRLAMKEKLETTEAGELYKLRKQTVEPVFGIIKSVMGFRRFHLRGLAKVTTEWILIAHAYNCKRMARLQAA